MEAAVKATVAGDDMTFGTFKVEIRRGPAPDTSKGIFGMGSAIAAARKLAHEKDEERLRSQMRQAEDAAARSGKDTAAHKQALSVVAKLNAQLRASKLVLQSQMQADEMGISARKTNPDSTDFHAIIPINDYPQKARWRVTNKETMVQLIDMTGASVTNKGGGLFTNTCLANNSPQVSTMNLEKNPQQMDHRSYTCSWNRMKSTR